MFLKFQTTFELPALATSLVPNATEESIDWDHENVYEWMYIDLPELDFSLNISREHGYTDLDDEVLDQYEGDETKIKSLANPGPVYVFGWNRNESDYVDRLPDWLPRFFADRLAVDVSVYDARINVDNPDPDPISLVKPTTGSGR